jgi:hypothetical protein
VSPELGTGGGPSSAMWTAAAGSKVRWMAGGSGGVVWRVLTSAVGPMRRTIGEGTDARVAGAPSPSSPGLRLRPPGRGIAQPPLSQPSCFDVAAMGLGTCGSMLRRQLSRCRPPLRGHELLHRLVAALHLKGREDRPLLRGTLLRLRVRRQVG